MTGPDSTRWQPVILDEDVAADRDTLARLRGDPALEFLDHRDAQRAELGELRPPVGDGLLAEGSRWVYYPWRRTVVALLGPRAFHRLRLDRNRNLITAEEQHHLGRLSIGVAGLSVGHVIAHTLAAQGLCGELRLADFDVLELSNLNRVPSGVLDLGVNKAVAAARRIAELDPYLPITVFLDGVTNDTVDDFVAGTDVVVEECDSLDIKAVVREVARRHRVPVLMATSDRGLIDVERFDLEPQRPILHGLLGSVDAEELAGMSARDKIPHMLGHLDVPRASARAAASMVEVGRTLTTWPQLAADVILGATTIAEAVRRLGLGEPLPSGRTRVDVSGALDGLAEPPQPAERAAAAEPGRPQVPSGVLERIAEAANRAPSGGNSQPWHIETEPDSVTVRLRTEGRATIDVAHRGGAVAVGAAVFNARVAASAHQRLGPVSWHQDSQHPLAATVQLTPGTDPALAELYDAMWHRETNRNRGRPGALDADTVAALEAAASGQGARLQLITTDPEIGALIEILAATDRIRYLTPHLHREMISELRWPTDPEPDTGIDVGLLGLDESDLAVLEVLRRSDVMAHLARWDAGSALGEEVGERIRVSSGLGVVWVDGQALLDYARGGQGAEAVWVAAAARGLAVQPISPVFLHAHDERELRDVSAPYAAQLQELSDRFRRTIGVPEDAGLILLLRFAEAPPTAGRSRRRALAGQGR
ncbi:Rv1355c family protein [[Mycobacterium] wendilense]|uniref:Rv1355c family protein n=1 Tax=[Mycobacterium] wendilense TaxID=3064284 RepID=A0ABM9MIF7_9MYCO|nr:Rv1355c family protein [Mycolicibacterium sp. MU0050]CAJ1585951.1 Rv1355c family protein [Mycolicibacterium sp. MU0050]